MNKVSDGAGKVLASGAASVKVLAEQAAAATVNLRGAHLSGANLRGANLRRADLRGADLYRSDLRGANLIGARLRGAQLRGAELYGANLTGANLTGANLTGANFDGADLAGATFCALPDDREAARADILRAVATAPDAVPGLLAALIGGRVDGNRYTGECACLLGTIANLRGCSVASLAVAANADSPAESWFAEISPGHTPQLNEAAALAVAWIEEWAQTNGVQL